MAQAKEISWEFPEDTMVNRAMIDALIAYLAEQDVIDTEELVKRFQARLEKYLEKGEPVAEVAG